MACESAAEYRLRIGAVSYLNAKPLVYRLAEIARGASLVFDLPSRLADRLARGDLDVALLPSVESLTNPDYVVVSDACIACRGPVLSVKLLSRVPARQIRTLALDEGSRASSVLARIFLQQAFGVEPALESLPIGSGLGETSADAVLLIGDRAIRPPRERFVEQWDLGDEWFRRTHLPFVFAMWTARGGIAVEAIEPVFRGARDAGVSHLTEIARRESAFVGLPEAVCLAYLRDSLHFTMGPEERRGLDLFHRYARDMGLAAVDHGRDNIGLSVS